MMTDHMETWFTCLLISGSGVLFACTALTQITMDRVMMLLLYDAKVVALNFFPFFLTPKAWPKMSHKRKKH